MPCVTEITGNDEAKHFETLLCKACKFLSVEQIESLKNPGSGICDGIDWYSQHLWMDCLHNNEYDVLHFIDEEDKESERLLSLQELKRIGYKIKELGYASELIKSHLL